MIFFFKALFCFIKQMKNSENEKIGNQKAIKPQGITQAILSLKQIKRQKNIQKRELFVHEKQSIISKDAKPKKKKKSSKNDDAGRKRAKTLDAQGQFTRARLLNGIVDKIKEIREIPPIVKQSHIDVMNEINQQRKIYEQEKSEYKKQTHKRKQTEAQLIRELVLEVEDLKKELRNQEKKRQSALSSFHSKNENNQPARTKSQQRLLASSPCSQYGKDIISDIPNETYEYQRKGETTAPVYYSNVKYEKLVDKKENDSLMPNDILPPEYKRIEQHYQIDKFRPKMEHLPTYPRPSEWRSPTNQGQVKFSYQPQPEPKASSKPICKEMYQKEKKSPFLDPYNLKNPSPSYAYAQSTSTISQIDCWRCGKICTCQRQWRK